MLSRREGLILYWCEGDKKLDASMVGVTCGNAVLLRSFVDWLCKYYGANRNKVKLRLHLWDGAEEEDATNFWSKALDISKQSFQKTWFKKRSGKNKKYPFGLCRAAYYSKTMLLKILEEIDKEFTNSFKPPDENYKSDSTN